MGKILQNNIKIFKYFFITNRIFFVGESKCHQRHFLILGEGSKKEIFNEVFENIALYEKNQKITLSQKLVRRQAYQTWPASFWPQQVNPI